jgi:hypothetical protein
MARKKSMTEYKDIIRRLKAGQSIRGIQRATGCYHFFYDRKNCRITVVGI